MIDRSGIFCCHRQCLVNSDSQLYSLKSVHQLFFSQPCTTIQKVHGIMSSLLQGHFLLIIIQVYRCISKVQQFSVQSRYNIVVVYNFLSQFLLYYTILAVCAKLRHSLQYSVCTKTTGQKPFSKVFEMVYRYQVKNIEIQEAQKSKGTKLRQFC